MRIETLSIRDIGSHKQTDVDLSSPVTVFFGENSSGKTTAARSLELLLRGSVAAFEGARAHPLRDLVRRGEEAGAVQGSIVRRSGEKAVTLARRLTAKGVTTKVDGRDVTLKAHDFVLPVGVREPDAVLRVLAQTDSFFELGPDVQQTLLAALVDQSVPADVVKELPLHRLPEGFTPTTLTGIDGAYEAAYAARRNAKARLSGLRAEPDPDETEIPDLAPIEARLAELRQEEARLLAGTNDQRAKRQALDEERDRVRRRRDAAQSDLDAMPTAEKAQKRLADIGTALTGATEAWTKRTQMNADVTKLREDLGKLQAERKAPAPTLKCALAHEAKCALSGAAQKATVKKLDERIDALRAEITKTEGALPTVPDTKALEQERDRLTRGEGRRGELDRTVAEAQTEFDRLSQQLSDTVAVMDGESPELTRLRERIETGEGNLRAARELGERIRAYAEYTTAQTALQAEVNDLEVLCGALAPKGGIKEKLLGARLGALQDEVNRILGAFGLQVEYVAEPWRVRVNHSSGPQMGKAETFRAGVAHQVALAHVTGVRFFQCDGMDILDAGNRSAFFGVLDFAVAQNLIDQALVYATYTRPPGPSPVPWAKYVLIEFAGDASVVRPITGKE